MAFVLRRLGHGLVLLWALSVLTFVLAELAPGDFFSQMRLDPRISPETLDVLRQRYGLDEALPVRYGLWLASLGRGELGYSFAYHRPVGELLWPRAGNTLLLTGLATFVAWLAAVPLGAWTAWRRDGWADRATQAGTGVLLATPELLLGLAALLLAARSGLFPTGDMVSLDHDTLGAWGRLGDRLWHLALPTACLALATLPVLVRHVRAAVADALDAPYLRAAEGHGIPPIRRLFRWALPAAANPLVSLFGLSLATLLSGSLVIEVLLGWPGLGPFLLDAILARDVHVVIGATLLSGLFLVGGHLIADLWLYAVDPRIRREGLG